MSWAELLNNEEYKELVNRTTMYHILITTLLAWIIIGICLGAEYEEPEVTKFNAYEDEIDCPTPQSKWITQLFVPWGLHNRAYHTVPPELRLAPSTIKGAGNGIYATTFIPKNTWLAEYEGEVILQSEVISEYAFKIPRNGVIDHYLDSYNVDTCNWTRWINCAYNMKTENVIYVYCLGKVYLLTLKDILPEQELLFYYGHEYAQEHLGIMYKQSDTS